MCWEGESLLLICFRRKSPSSNDFFVDDFVSYFHGFNRFGFDIHSNFDWHNVID